MAEEVKSADAPVQQPAKGPFVHSLRVYLVGGQQFTLNEVTDSPEVPRNVVVGAVPDVLLGAPGVDKGDDVPPVSYTHLTLPTIA